MKISDAIIQGIIQGLTEFLPVSSSGHLLISQHILGVRENNLFFNVMLHIGTLLAVLAVYRKEVGRLILAFFSILGKMIRGKFNLKKIDASEQMVLMIITGLLPLILLFLPIPKSGMNVKDVAEELSNESNIIIAGLALILTSILINKGIHVKRYTKFSKIKYDTYDGVDVCSGKIHMNFIDALWIGVMQLIAAIFPGISRSGSTLSVGLLRGINKKTALDYSFILGIPSIIAASLLEFKEALDQDLISSIAFAPVLTGILVSAIVGFLSIKLFKWLLKTDKMIIFVVYTFVIGLAAVLIGIFERIKGFNIFTGNAL